MSKIDKYEIDRQNIPRHVAIIMDGNGRWAKKRKRLRTFGHRQGMKALKETLRESAYLGIKVLTVYAFSTENWKRPKDEVTALMSMLIEYLKIEIKELCEEGVKIKIIGNKEHLPKDVMKAIQEAEELTKDNQRITFNIAFNYGGRNEIVNAVKRMVKEGVKSEDITEELFSSYLYTSGCPDPDLLIRTGGDNRISNFLLYQCAYSELYFTKPDLLWPDFTCDDLYQAIAHYQQRQRRFGGV